MTDYQHDLELAVESLETRRLLAGNVNVAVIGGGDLRLRGDDSNNVVTIETNDDGDYEITGTDGTTINGQSSIVITAEISFCRERIFVIYSSGFRRPNPASFRSRS